MTSRTPESVMDALERVREERDVLYSQTVNPRRNAERALKHLIGDPDTAREYLEDVVRGLHRVADLYRAQTKDED